MHIPAFKERHWCVPIDVLDCVARIAIALPLWSFDEFELIYPFDRHMKSFDGPTIARFAEHRHSNIVVRLARDADDDIVA